MRKSSAFENHKLSCFGMSLNESLCCFVGATNSSLCLRCTSGSYTNTSGMEDSKARALSYAHS